MSAVAITEASRPALPRHVRLQRDEARQRWVIQAPERVLAPDDLAASIIAMLDGVTRLSAIIDRLAEDYQAERTVIAADVLAMLQDLADQGFLVDHGEEA